MPGVCLGRVLCWGWRRRSAPSGCGAVGSCWCQPPRSCGCTMGHCCPGPTQPLQGLPAGGGRIPTPCPRCCRRSAPARAPPGPCCYHPAPAASAAPQDPLPRQRRARAPVPGVATAGASAVGTHQGPAPQGPCPGAREEGGAAAVPFPGTVGSGTLPASPAGAVLSGGEEIRAWPGLSLPACSAPSLPPALLPASIPGRTQATFWGGFVPSQASWAPRRGMRPPSAAPPCPPAPLPWRCARAVPAWCPVNLACAASPNPSRAAACVQPPVRGAVPGPRPVLSAAPAWPGCARRWQGQGMGQGLGGRCRPLLWSCGQAGLGARLPCPARAAPALRVGTHGRRPVSAAPGEGPDALPQAAERADRPGLPEAPAGEQRGGRGARRGGRALRAPADRSCWHWQVKLVNIRNDDIADGNPKLTLGLIWTIILHFQVSPRHARRPSPGKPGVGYLGPVLPCSQQRLCPLLSPLLWERGLLLPPGRVAPTAEPSRHTAPAPRRSQAPPWHRRWGSTGGTGKLHPRGRVLAREACARVSHPLRCQRPRPHARLRSGGRGCPAA